MPRRRRAKAGNARAASYSLFGEILDWMLAPLLFLWPISIILTYDVATRIANQPYDNVLIEETLVLGRELRAAGGRGLPAEAVQGLRRLLRSDAEDTVYFQVRDGRGRLLAGDTELLPPADWNELVAHEVSLRDGETGGEELRIAALRLPLEGPLAPEVLLQVGETRHKRNALSTRIVSGVLLPQFAIIPLAVMLVWFGLSRGIAPLTRLQALIRRRNPDDLSPVDAGNVPEEVRPVVVAFNDMMARLEDNLQSQRRFIADAAHQMRTPLAGLKTQTELALRETDPAEMHAALKRVLAGTERSARLLNQMLSLARAETRPDKAHAMQALDFDELVRTVAAEHVPAALARGIEIAVDSPGMTILLTGSALLLHEMVANLVDNAIKYCPRGGHVSLRLIAADTVILEVEDDGPGIPGEDRERVFERFYRVLGSNTEGSGLGLAIVREIAEAHGASVALADGRSGHGTLVTVSLPRSVA